MKKYLLTTLVMMAASPVMANAAYGDFDSFTYQIDGKCRTPESYLYFNYLSEKGHYALETDDQENDYKANFNLYLLDDGTYVLSYEVHKVRDYISNGYRYDVVYETVFEGNVLASPDKLILGNLGELTILHEEGKKRSVLKFSEDKEQYIQKNMEVVLLKISSTSSILDEQCD